MKLKQKPGDFQVREVFSFEEDPKGEYYVHRLRKEKVDTLEALDRISQFGEIPREDIAYAGLKDRQGLTEQFLSIKGQKVELRDPDLKVTFVGRCAKPVTSKMSDGNRFTIVIRDMSSEEVVRMRRNKTALMSQGLPDYFDDQRFGSLAQGQGLVMLPIYKRKPDVALRQLFATPSMKDNARGGDQKLRQLLKEHWGDWQTCKDIARGPMYRTIFEHLLRNPEDFRGALELLPMRLKLIHLYSFQSALWNRAVSRFIGYSTQGSFTIPSLNGPLAYWRYLDEEQHEQLGDKEFELIAPKTQCQDRLFQRTVQNVLREMGLDAEELRIAIKGMSLKEEMRRLILKPEGFRIEGPEPDETNKGRFKATVHFQLPRGSYATLVVKRLFAGARVPRSQHGEGGDPGPRYGDRREQREDRGAYQGAHRGQREDGRGRDDRGGYQGGRRDQRDDRGGYQGGRRDQRDDRGGYQGGRRDQRDDRGGNQGGRRDQRDDRGGYQGGHRDQRDDRGGYQGGRRDQRDDRGGYQGGRRDQRDDRGGNQGGRRDQRDDRGGYQGGRRDQRDDRGGYQGGRRDQRDDRGGYQGGRRDQRDDRGGYQGGRRDQRDDRGGNQGGRRDQRDDRGGYQGGRREDRQDRQGRGGHAFFQEEKQALPNAIRRKKAPESSKPAKENPSPAPVPAKSTAPVQAPSPAPQSSKPVHRDNQHVQQENSTGTRKKTRRVSVLRRLLK